MMNPRVRPEQWMSASGGEGKALQPISWRAQFIISSRKVANDIGALPEHGSLGVECKM